ncbi:hypothetical protein BKG95_09425 [Rodentibacter pneumotropicus]|uniref:YdgA family protein n=1 Tax=Rodentibacter pneumotropicus TaxID=758 RepID=A0AAW5L9X5_9PAST|nr:YdgA family protein [Rodentibacter pneumotropicus]MCQ9120437.1 YdgA family protein [Rodentibacter pneumotropicus]OOF66901.1 hypothetical protein BKG95_09425 [Rodentibacter pneumotropicus]
MKKSKIAIGVIAVLGAAWVGGVWFTGQTAETEYKRQIELANQRFRTLGDSDSFNIEFKNKQFERGFFSSQVEDEIVISLEKEEKQWTIPFSTTLYHGPLPLNQLMKFDFMPVMFSAEGFITKNESTQPLFDVIKSDKPIQYRASTSYGLTTKGTVEVAGGEVSYSEPSKEKAAWSSINIGFAMDKALSGEYEFSADELTFHSSSNGKRDSASDEGVESKTQLKGIKYKGSVEPTKWTYIQTGKGTSSIDSIEISAVSGASKTLSIIEKGVKGITEVDVKDDFLNFKSINSIDSLIIDMEGMDKTDLGKLVYNVELNHLEANSVNALFESFINIFKEGYLGNSVTIKQIVESWFAKHSMAIFNNQPQIKFNPISISDNQGKLALDLNVALSKDPKFDLMSGGLYNQFTDFAVNIELDKATLEAILTKFTSEEERTNIKAKIGEMASEGANNGIVVNSEKSVTMKLALENGKLSLNGQAVPEEQAKNIIFMLLMSAVMRH